MIRVHGDLEPVPRYRDLTPTQLKESIYAILTEQNVQQSLRLLGPQDVLITPQLDGLTAADFDRAIDFMRLGELQA